MRKFLIAVFVISLSVFSFAQEHDGNNDNAEKIQSILDVFSKIKVNGYIQAQYQNAEENGAKSYIGGNFPSDSKSRFMVRRGRLKTTYNNDLSKAVFQLDIRESGVGIKDAYLEFTDPWVKTFSLTAGYFDNPFGFENSFSSSKRESPERTKMTQVLLPGEKDLGVQLTIAPGEGILKIFNLKAGLFNGTGGKELDNAKDFIGRLGFDLPSKNKSFELSGGVSLYAGSSVSRNETVISFDEISSGLQTNSSDNLNKSFNRQYYGADLQAGLNILPFGKTTLRGEFVTGEQPSSENSFRFYESDDPLYLRNFTGYYVYFIQNFLKKNEFVIKYDVFDPNTDTELKETNAVSLASAEDVKFTTLGFGLNHHWDKNIKFMFYYDMVSNEEIDVIPDFKSNLKDNVFTFRIQYKF